jgi:hypothetical protein
MRLIARLIGPHRMNESIAFVGWGKVGLSIDLRFFPYTNLHNMIDCSRGGCIVDTGGSHSMRSMMIIESNFESQSYYYSGIFWNHRFVLKFYTNTHKKLPGFASNE